MDLEVCNRLLAVLMLVALSTDVHAVLPVTQRAVDQLREFACDGEDGHRVSVATRDATEPHPQRRVGALQRDGGHAQRTCDPGRPRAVGLFAAERLASRDRRARRQPQPAGEMLVVRERAKSRSHLGQDRARGPPC